jgi:hypothetical protein
MSQRNYKNSKRDLSTDRQFDRDSKNEDLVSDFDDEDYFWDLDLDDDSDFDDYNIWQADEILNEWDDIHNFPIYAHHHYQNY